jgi:general stress protein YciG
MNQPTKYTGKPRGFAAMDPERQRQIASLGGRTAHETGHAHQFTSEEAREAGKLRHSRKAKK